MSENLIKTTFPIKGYPKLGCGNAEKVLLGLRGVKSVKPSFSDHTITVVYDGMEISEQDMAYALEKAGYTLVLKENAVTVRNTGNDRKKSDGQDNAIRITLGVKGMSCSGCEAKIERILLRMNGIKQAKASFANNTVAIEYENGATDIEAMAAALSKAGYELQTGKQVPANGKKKFSINQFLGVAIILFAAYFIIDKTVGFNFIPAIDQSAGYGVLFLVGLLTSLHCVAMCGGINMSQCIAKDVSGAPAGSAAKLRPSLLYNTGRVVSYTIIGGIVGAFGSVVSFSGWARGIVAVLSGLFMILMGVGMLGIFPWINKITPRMPRFLRSKAGEAGKGKGPFIVGLLNGLMPCGPLQAMQLYALGSGGFFAGALSMFLFSLGTVPLMFGLGALSSILSHKFTARMMKVSAALVLFLGLVMVNRGFALAGVNLLPAAQANPAAGTQPASIEKTSAGDVQAVTSKLTPGGYPQITVRKGIPVKWNLQADAKDLNGCNRTLVIPKYNKQIDLKAGDNIIEFTPTEAGTIPYSCWMGMITSRIVVVDGPVTASSAEEPSIASPGGAQALSGGCCGSGTATQFAGGKIPTDQIAVAKIENGVQVVTITVNDRGYTPAVAVVQKGVKTKIRFVAEKLNSCDAYVYFPDYGGGLDLSAGELETPELTPEKDFTFECGMSMLHGYVKVVTDINNVNLDDIRNEVAAWEPPAGSGGCCG